MSRLRFSGVACVVLGVVTLLGSASPAAASSAAYAHAVQADGPQSWWRLSDNYGSTAFDSQGRSNGDPINVQFHRPAAPAGKYAMGFNGLSSRVSVGYGAQRQDLSVEAWIRTTSGGTIYTSSTLNYGYALEVGGGFLEFFYAPGPCPQGCGTGAVAPDTVSDGQWHYIVATHDQNGAKLFVDGSLVASSGADRIYYAPGSGPDQAWIGTDFRQYFKGDIEDVAVYDHALSAEAVVSHYQAGLAGDSPGINGDGTPAPAAGCQQPHVSVPGVGVLYASCFSYDKASRTFSATGHVRFNGLDIEPVDASVPNQVKVSIQPTSAQLTIEGDAQLKIGSVVVWKLKHEKLSYQLKVPGAAKTRLVLRNIEQRVQAKLKGFPLQGDISLDFSPDNGGTITAGLHVALQKPIPDVTGDAQLSLSNANGLRINSLEFKVPEAKLGPISISDLDVKYDSASDTWEGKLTATFPVKPRELTVHAGGKFVHGQFDSAYASAKGLGIALANPAVFLNDIDLSVSREPRFEGGVAVTAGPELSLGSSKLRLLGLQGSLLYERPGGHSHFKLSGKVVVLSNWGHVQGQIEYWPDTSTVLFGGGFNFPDPGFPFPTFGFSASGGLNGGFRPGGFNVEGNATIKWEQHVDIGFIHKTISFEQGATGLISDRGIAVCHIGWPNVGLGFSWSSNDLKAFGDSCDISPWRSTAFSSSARAAGPPSHRFLVRRGLSFEAFNVLGRGGVPPSVSIRGPHGESAQTSSDFSPVSGPKFLIMQIPSQSRTFIEVRTPAQGSWTVTPTAGSGAITGYQQSDPLPAPAIHATVSGRGSARQLSWRMRTIRGQRVTFVEQASRLVHMLAATTAPRGHRSFTPAAGPPGRRTIIAQLEQDGLPRRDLVVATYIAPAQPRPTRISGLRVSLQRRSLTVRWRGSAHATGYELRLALTDGRRVLVDLSARTHSYRLADVDPATGATASLQPLNDVAGDGPVSHARLKPPTGVLATKLPRRIHRNQPLTLSASTTRSGTLNLELLDSHGDIVRFTRARLHGRGTRRITVATKSLRPGTYTVLVSYSLDASFKPYIKTANTTIR